MHLSHRGSLSYRPTVLGAQKRRRHYRSRYINKDNSFLKGITRLANYLTNLGERNERFTQNDHPTADPDKRNKHSTQGKNPTKRTEIRSAPSTINSSYQNKDEDAIGPIPLYQNARDLADNPREDIRYSHLSMDN